LRREEVAFLADIGVKWYTRLEMGDDVHPSPKTLQGLSRALRLSRDDTEYLFELSGLAMPKEPFEFHIDVPQTLTTLVTSIQGVMAAVTDLLLTPLRWNAIADAVWGCSSFGTPLERNAIVRTFNGDPFVRQYVGDDYDKVLRDEVGLFRRYYAVADPDPFAQQIYEKIRESPRFQKLWEAGTVTDYLNRGEVIVRHHPSVGALTMMALDLQFPHRSDLVLKLWLPEDDKTRQRFAQLALIGKPSATN
jgi:transcriptional regulator with XRE-family HTH domain